MVSSAEPVQLMPLLAAKLRVWTPVPIANVAEPPKFSVPTVSEFPVVAPVLKIPPFKATGPLAITLEVPKVRVPSLMLVRPVYKFAPENISVPAPVFVTAPVVLVLAPDMVSVLAVTSMVEVVPAVNT